MEKNMATHNKSSREEATKAGVERNEVMDGFLPLYANGLDRFGYRNSPLEAMAYSLQARFDREAQPFSVEAACQSLIRDLTITQELGG